MSCGYTPAMMDELADLVVAGPKRATATLVADYEVEGDGTLVSWRRDHWSFFDRRSRELGVAMSEDLLIVFERFEVVQQIASLDSSE